MKKRDGEREEGAEGREGETTRFRTVLPKHLPRWQSLDRRRLPLHLSGQRFIALATTDPIHSSGLSGILSTVRCSAAGLQIPVKCSQRRARRALFRHRAMLGTPTVTVMAQ